MLTLVDSNVLLDLLERDSTWGSWSRERLEDCANEGDLCINSIIYAEVSVGFRSIEEVESAFPDSYFRRALIPMEAAFVAGKAYVQYRRRGGSRTLGLPDFFIGAHAAVAGMRLLTRDLGRYRTYFPTIEIIAP
jgi:predicted nucleic acid-binding protein